MRSEIGKLAAGGLGFMLAASAMLTSPDAPAGDDKSSNRRVHTSACADSVFTGHFKNKPQKRHHNRDRLEVEGAEITLIRTQDSPGGTGAPVPFAGSPAPAVPFCEVEVTLTHGVEANGALPPDIEKIWIWLPDEWNGRFVTLGGGGTSARANATAMGASLALGYAVSTGDSSVQPQFQPNIFVQNGLHNWQLFENWSYRGIHDTAVVSKDAIEAYYKGEGDFYSYWSGCSNGGRQGLEMAQRYPSDYDGVMSAAPAIYAVARQNLMISWPAFIQNDAFGANIPACKRTAIAAAVLAACDAGDGVVDLLVSNPDACDFRAAVQSTVGTTPTNCATITQAEADVVNRIYEGPREPDGRFLWYGYPPGSAIPTTDPNFWIRNFLIQDLTFDYRTSNTDELLHKWYPMGYNNRLAILEGSDPVLEPFANRGGKILLWHGVADNLVSSHQSVHYWNEVDVLSAPNTADFFRLFLAPGVGHCGGGTGPTPVDPLAALVAWVENDEAPDTLLARRIQGGVVTRERNLCPYPQVQVYNGTGDINAASSFSCGDYPAP